MMYYNNCNYSCNNINKNSYDKFKTYFQNLCKTNKQNAISIINSNTLTFPCFYVLTQDIETQDLINSLNKRNQIALKFCSDFNNIPCNEYNSTLKWMFFTGCREENFDDYYDEIIDHCAGELLLSYNDKTVLNPCVELMFNRNRKGKLIHDLAWYTFQSHQVDVMPLVGKYIRSNNQTDNQLAYQLLNFKPELQPNDKEQQYKNFQKWFNKNKKYLYCTGDSMQLTSKPKHWRVNQAAKYINTDSTYKGDFLKPLPAEKEKILKDFNSLDYNQKKSLAKYSYEMHYKNPNDWKNFINSPIQKQIEVARKDLGGER